MAAHRKSKKKESETQQHWFVHHLPKILAGILATGAAGGTTLSMSDSKHANERTAVLETKVERTQQDTADNAKKIDRVDRRTIRMEEGIRLLLEKHGVKQDKQYGPKEQ